jgi:choline dehydrogenase-like flavoprotein
VSVAAVPEATAGELRVFADYDRDFSDSADVVVVGSGPCGAVAAAELARAGKRVLLLEEGPPFSVDDFVIDGSISMARTMREAGLRVTRGTVMPTMQAIALGGGSLVNSAICVRAPDFVLERWAGDFELDHTTRKDLDPHYDAVAEQAGIAPTPDAVQGARNLLFRRGCDALGWSSEPIARNVRGCRGSGECFTGCRSRAKQSVDVSYVPGFVRDGGRVLTSLRVERVVAEGRRARGVEGRVVAPFSGAATHRFRIDARAVVLAAGTCATPVLLQKSGDLANRSGQVGRNLQFHPGVAVMGVFDEPVEPGFGATQGYQSLEFVREGFKLETLWAPPGVLAVRLPGQGLEFKHRLAEIRHAAVWDAISSCHHSLGRVRARRGASLDPVLHWRLDPRDVAIMTRALWVLCQLFFAAGARKILPGIHGVAEEMHSLAEAEVFRDRPLDAAQIVTAGNHVFCATRMHGDPRRGVVDPLGKCHDLDNLWIVDTGIFPQSPSVNPMFTGMALARRAALALAEQV